MARSNSEGGYDNDTHYLIQIKEPPASIIALREELPKHPNIYGEAQKGNTFEECLGIIAAKLDIVLDGLYDADDLCQLLLDCLRKRHMFPDSPHLRSSKLRDVELIEREGTVEINERDREQLTITPDGAVVTESNKKPSVPNGGTEGSS